MLQLSWPGASAAAQSSSSALLVDDNECAPAALTPQACLVHEPRYAKVKHAIPLVTNITQLSTTQLYMYMQHHTSCNNHKNNMPANSACQHLHGLAKQFCTRAPAFWLIKQFTLLVALSTADHRLLHDHLPGGQCQRGRHVGSGCRWCAAHMLMECARHNAATCPLTDCDT